MFNLEQNKQTLYYALYTGKVPMVDANGFKTGEYTKTYSDPVKLRANVSGSKGGTYQWFYGGSAGIEPFGIDVDYSKTFVVDDMDCPITEESIVWIGIEPTEETVDGEKRLVFPPHNYMVSKISRALNSIVYAIKEVRRG